MSTTSSSAVTALLRQSQPPVKSKPLASSSSVFFRFDELRNRGGIAFSCPKTATKRGLSCNCLFGLGVPELVVIVGVTALVFGPKQLPEVGRSIGKTVKSFQQAAKEFETELKKDEEEKEDEEAAKEIA